MNYIATITWFSSLFIFISEMGYVSTISKPIFVVLCWVAIVYIIIGLIYANYKHERMRKELKIIAEANRKNPDFVGQAYDEYNFCDDDSEFWPFLLYWILSYPAIILHDEISKLK